MPQPVMVVDSTNPSPRIPMASSSMPSWSTRTGPNRCDSGAPMPEAANEPTARASRITPVWSAS